VNADPAMLHPSIQCDPTHTLMTSLLVWFFSPAKVLCDITSGPERPHSGKSAGEGPAICKNAALSLRAQHHTQYSLCPGSRVYLPE